MTGPSIEKSIAPLRSFVAEPMRFGNLFLAGDAAHIVPPTGAKGLNLADLRRVLPVARRWCSTTTTTTTTTSTATRRWRCGGCGARCGSRGGSRKLLHRFPDQTEFDQRAQEVELDYLASSVHAQASVCEQYAGLPFED